MWHSLEVTNTISRSSQQMKRRRGESSKLPKNSISAKAIYQYITNNILLLNWGWRATRASQAVERWSRVLYLPGWRGAWLDVPLVSETNLVLALSRFKIEK